MTDKYAELREELAKPDGQEGEYFMWPVSEARALLAERDALVEQHHCDSKELRSLCAARDEARKQRDRSKGERDVLAEILGDALAPLRVDLLNAEADGDCEDSDGLRAIIDRADAARAALKGVQENEKESTK